MRYLIPFDLAQLGLPESLWLLLALGGLSLLAPAAKPRWRGALLFTAFLAVFAWADRLTGTSAATLGQRILLCGIGAASILVGSLPLPRQARWGWLGALVVVSLALRPFDLHPVDNVAEWAFLAFAGVAMASILAPEATRAFVARTWWIGVLAFAALCHLATPFDVFDLPVAVAVLVLIGLAWGVMSQGRELRRYVKRRLIGTPIVLLLLITISFFLIRAAPGGPFDKEKPLDAVTRAAIEKEWDLDKPLVVQYRNYIGGLIWDGDMRPSFKQRDRTVNEIVATHIGPSAVLGVSALLIALLIGMSAGLVSGIRRNSIFDYASMTVAMIGLAVPTFVVGPLLVLVFAMHLDWFPVTGWGTLQDLVLPAVTLSLPFAARVARLTRAGMLEVVHQDYIRTARAKGLKESTIVVRHTLKGSLIPVVSFLGPAVAQMLTGSLVVEIIFGVPGLGREFVQSALNRDYFLVLGLVLTFGVLLIVFTLVVDILYAFLDPRIRHG